MPNVRPTLGYRSRTEAVVALRTRGFSRPQIAEAIGVSLHYVSATERSAAKAKKRLTPSTMPSQIIVCGTLLDALRPAAERRSISIDVLMRNLVSVVVADGLVDAILDDGICGVLA